MNVTVVFSTFADPAHISNMRAAEAPRMQLGVSRVPRHSAFTQAWMPCSEFFERRAKINIGLCAFRP
jgi:hypothetical protein